jgi:putative addiction module component (TIGR02574 family)
MPQLLAELSARAQALVPEEPARLAEQLLASLAPQDAAVEAAWDEELRQRIEEVERGTVDLTPDDQVYARVRQATA